MQAPAWAKTWKARIGLGLAALIVAGAGVATIVDGGPATRPAGAPLRTAAEPQPRGVTAPTGLAPVNEASSQLFAQKSADAAAGGATLDATNSAAGAAAAPPIAEIPTAGPKVVKTASLRVQVKRHGLTDVVDRAAAVAAHYGGFVENTSTATDADDHATADLTVRVPADRFDAARHDLRGLGTVKGEELRGDDVTSQLVDYDARIRSLQAQEEALRTLLSKATRVGEVLEVQGQLFNVRQQIEQLQAQRTQLDRQASLATLQVSFFEPGAAAVRDEPAPRTGLARSWHQATQGAVNVIGGMVIVVGYALPIAVLLGLAWGVSRLRRRPVAATPSAPVA